MNWKILLCVVTVVVTIAFAGQLPAQESSTGVKGKSSYIQLSLVPPLSTNGFRSYQYSNHISINFLAGLSQNESGFALGGLANLVRGQSKGFMLAGLVNHVGNGGRGALFSGGMNIVYHSYSGWMFAGLTNVAQDVDGFQFAGLLNKAKDVNGVQLAGLINVAENSDCPIGLINIIKNGEMGVAITYDEMGSALLSFRSGGKYTYGIVGMGYNHKTHGRSYAAQVGYGVHIPCTSWLRVNNELKVSCFGYSNDPLIIHDDHLKNTVIHVGYSLLPAFRLHSRVELFGGPSINYVDAGWKNKETLPSHSLWDSSGSGRFRQIHLGFQAGVQYAF